jgi:hypothetical protein
MRAFLRYHGAKSGVLASRGQAAAEPARPSPDLGQIASGGLLADLITKAAWR